MEDNNEPRNQLPAQKVVQFVAAPDPPPTLANADVQCIAQAVVGILQPVPKAGIPSPSQPGKCVIVLLPCSAAELLAVHPGIY